MKLFLVLTHTSAAFLSSMSNPSHLSRQSNIFSSTSTTAADSVIEDSVKIDSALFTPPNDVYHSNILTDDDLITKAKEYLSANQGVDAPDMLSADFHFFGPVVGGDGGLSKEAYLKAVGGFKITEGFPDLNPRFHHFRVDPFDGRVWFTSRAIGTHTGLLLGIHKPTGKKFSTPPQACSLSFDDAGKVTKYTIGHVMDRTVGNTGGMGGIFGPLYAIGKPLPFPEAKPYSPSLRFRLFNFLGSLAQKFSKE